MAARKKINTNMSNYAATASFFVLCCVLSFLKPVNSVRTKTKIYIDLKTQAACFRRLNATHQAGCGSPEAGNVGVIYYIQTEDDFNWVVSRGPNSPYIAVLEASDFNGTSVRRLRDSGRVNGIMVLDWGNQTKPDSFSTADTCPNDIAGLYRDSSEYRDCKKQVWNLAGSGLDREDIGFPVFLLTDLEDIHNVVYKCFQKFNQRGVTGEAHSHPLCAAELTSFMHAAVDGTTCMRRNGLPNLSLSTYREYCDPISDSNIHATMLNTSASQGRANDSVIVVAARLDSTSLFQNEYWSADTSVTGMVGLLAAMQALWKVEDVIQSTQGAKDVMFAIFNGENYDYIGSSNMVYMMQQKNFPQADKAKGTKKQFIHNIELGHISQFVELGQVGLREDGGSLWMHTDPGNRQVAGSEIEKMMSGLQVATQGLDLAIQEANESLPLPPASAQRFLMGRRDIPTVVLTDHKHEFTNKYYSSRFDRADTIDAGYPESLPASERYDYITQQATMLSNVSTALARYLFEASTGLKMTDELKEKLTADVYHVNHMLYCFMISPRCELFNETIRPRDQNALNNANQPYTFYVGVTENGNINPTSHMVYLLMIRYTGQKLDLQMDKCEGPSNDMRYTYMYLQGELSPDGKTREGWCMKSLAMKREAKSPAFMIEGYDKKSGLYSTWTESRWSNKAFSVRLFLVPSQQLQLSVLATGVVILVVSLVLAYFCESRSEQIFYRGPTNRVSAATMGATAASTSYSHMI